MSLLQKASIITTPTAYAEDYLYSIKPAYALNEVVVNGTFDTDSDWGKSAGVTISNGKATVVVTGGGFQYINQNISYDLGATYRVKLTVQGLSGSSGKAIRFQDDGGNLGTLFQIKTLDETVQTFEAEWTPNSESEVIQIARSTSSGDYSFTVDNVSVKKIEEADFDFDRNSTGTRVNEDYLIEDVPYNLLAYSQDFTQWTNSNSTDSVSTTLSPDGSSFSTNFAENTATAQHKLSRSVSFDGGSTYTFSVFVKSNGRDIYLDVGNNTRFGGRASFNLNTGVATTVMGTPSIENFGNGWFRCMVTGASTSAGSTTLELLTFNGSTNSYEGDGSSGVFVWGAQVVKGDKPKNYLKTTDRLDIPRIDYTNGEPSILLEPQRANAVTHSNDVTDSGNVYTNMSGSVNQTTSPEGITNAGKLIENTANGEHYFTRTQATSSGNYYTFSFFAKYNGRGASMNIGASRLYAHFDLETGEVIASGNNSDWQNLSTDIVNYGNGWYRCIMTGESVTGAGGYIRIATNNGSTVGHTSSYTGDGVSGIFVYGIQLEIGSYATSLIHTSGSAVTRSADAANNAANSDLINSTEGVVYGEIKSFIELPDSKKVISISDGTSGGNVVRIQFHSASNTIRGQVRANNSLTASLSKIVSTTLEYHKVAYKYKENDFALWVDGEQVFTDTNGAVPNANSLNILSFSDGNNTNKFNEGAIKMVAIFKEALSDTELAKLTGYNNHELYMNYYNRLSYLGLVEEYNVESDINNYIL